MERPCRERGDELLKPGELTGVRRRLRKMAPKHDLVSVIACAFDHRSRMLPLVYVSTHLAPAGGRAIGAAMVDCGFHKTRIVLQHWNRNFRPSRMQLDGRMPDLFMISSLQVYSAECKALIRDACRIEPSRRPLIVVGGAKAIYQAWDLFSADPQDPWGADVAVTGEEYVLLNLLEVVLSTRAAGESVRAAFLRAREAGLLDHVAGLVYPRGRDGCVPQELVDTGVERLVGDLDELPDPVLGFRLLESPGRKVTLGSRALAASRVRKYSKIGSIVVTSGCKLSCSFCPIPAQSQHQLRSKSGPQLADEMVRLYKEYGIKDFFGCDDNLFADKTRTIEILESLARTQIRGARLHETIRWATEATLCDTLRMKDYLPLAREAGVQGLWLGVEDMTAMLINKGQTVDKTVEVFRLLRQHGICPMPMMIHHDSQPLYTRGDPYGLLNQVRLLRKAGAVSFQVFMMTPTIGSRIYEQAFTSGLVYERVGGRKVEQRMFDGNYVIQSAHGKPWQKQINLMAAYVYFYNPLRLLGALIRPKSKVFLADACLQVLGMWGLTQTIRRTLGWALRLMLGKIRRATKTPASPIPMRSAAGGPATYAAEATGSSSRRPGDARPLRSWRPAERSLDKAEV